MSREELRNIVREALLVPVISLLSECEDTTLSQTLCNVSPVSCRAAQCGVGWPVSEIGTSSPGKRAAEATVGALAAMQWRTADGCGSSITGIDKVICWLALMAAQAAFGSRAGVLNDSHISPGRQCVRRWGTSERAVTGPGGDGVLRRCWALPESAVMSLCVRGICSSRFTPPGRAVLSLCGSRICGSHVRRAGVVRELGGVGFTTREYSVNGREKDGMFIYPGPDMLKMIQVRILLSHIERTPPAGVVNGLCDRVTKFCSSRFEALLNRSPCSPWEQHHVVSLDEIIPGTRYLHEMSDDSYSRGSVIFLKSFCHFVFLFDCNLCFLFHSLTSLYVLVGVVEVRELVGFGYSTKETVKGQRQGGGWDVHVF